jgi:hypothetical protein
MTTSRRNFIATLLGTVVIVPLVKLPIPQNLYQRLKRGWARYETNHILSSLPIRKANITSRQEAPLTLLSGPRRDLVRLNPVAARIWDLCDGRHSLDTMIQKVMGEYDISSRICAHDVLFTLRTFKEKGLISC